MRAFIGIFPPAPIARDIHAAAMQAGADLKVRWTAPENLHVTLAFLGDIEPADVAAAREALASACTRDAFDVALGGFGAFPNLRRARVGWIGAVEGAAAVGEIERVLRQALPRRLRPDDKRFHAHLTLTRFKQPPAESALQAVAEELAPLQWRFRATEALLVQSHLEAGGARYRPLERVPLAR